MAEKGKINLETIFKNFIRLGRACFTSPLFFPAERSLRSPGAHQAAR